VSKAVVRKSVTITGGREQVRADRVFVAGILGGCCPLADAAVLLVGEVVPMACGRVARRSRAGW
jgi:hypothetical protein